MRPSPRQHVSLAESLQRRDREASFSSFDNGRYRCQYLTWGQGPPLVFIHGLGDDLHTFLLPMAILSRHFRCIAYNQPTGVDDGARLRDWNHDDLVHNFFDLMDRLQLRETAVFGSSFGSTIALRAMGERPEQISRAVLQGGFAFRPLVSSEWWLSWLARFFPGTMRSLPLRRAAMLKVHQHAFFDREEDVWQFFQHHSGKAAIRTVAHWALVLHKTDLRPLLPAIRHPTLLVCGDRDPLVPHTCQKLLFDHLPNAVMFRINGCGHFPMFSHPEALADVVMQFMSAPPCALNGAPENCLAELCCEH